MEAKPGPPALKRCVWGLAGEIVTIGKKSQGFQKETDGSGRSYCGQKRGHCPRTCPLGCMVWTPCQLMTKSSRKCQFWICKAGAGVKLFSMPTLCISKKTGIFVKNQTGHDVTYFQVVTAFYYEIRLTYQIWYDIKNTVETQFLASIPGLHTFVLRLHSQREW